jgi:hypothetical protein
MIEPGKVFAFILGWFGSKSSSSIPFCRTVSHPSITLETRASIGSVTGDIPGIWNMHSEVHGESIENSSDTGILGVFSP